MAIKINWQDLLKRFINWQEIVRVYKNGWQIRPETVPPTPVGRWIYWDSNRWLISASLDGNSWFTIADKNLWASVVWNEWDTLSANNVGNMFQWGNNYPHIRWETINPINNSVDASWYWPNTSYYTNQDYLRWDNYTFSWDSSYNPNLRWAITWNVNGLWNWWKSWYHVPTGYEFEFVIYVLETLWLLNNVSTGRTPWDVLCKYLKFPLAWYRDNNWLTNDWVRGYYLSSQSSSDSNRAVWIDFNESSIITTAQRVCKCYGSSIRLFKNTPAIPNSSRTELYQWSSGWWVYWNQSLWLISISANWQYWITLEDKNLGASQVYNYGDTLSEANCGRYYQWGNTYWFPWIWNPDAWSIIYYRGSVDTRWYSVQNPYYSTTFVRPSNFTTYQDWQSPHNNNILWFTSAIRLWTKASCPEWFHIPTESDLDTFIYICDRFWGNNWTDKGTCEYFKLPLTWYADGSGWHYVGSEWFYWTSSKNYFWGARAHFFGIEWWRLYDSGIRKDDEKTWTWGFIRPFANTPIQPNSTRTVLYQPS